jgi:thiol-disulfide isomerase/thioredoxin
MNDHEDSRTRSVLPRLIRNRNVTGVRLLFWCVLLVFGSVGCGDVSNKKHGATARDASSQDASAQDLSQADVSHAPRKDVGFGRDSATTTRDRGSGSASIDRSTYPEGPYGTQEGSVIADLTFGTDTADPLSFGTLRENPTNKLLLVVTAAGWCTACIEEMPFLESLHQDYEMAGLVVLIAVFEDHNYSPATMQYAADWKAEYGLSCIVVHDPTFQFGSFSPASLTPMAMLVDLQTMAVLRVSSGIDRSSLEAGVAVHL